MLRSLLLTAAFAVLVMFGVSSSLAATLAYVWTDTFTPQNIAWEILPLIPVSLISALIAGFGYVLHDRRAVPRPYLVLVLMLAMAAWCAITTLNEPVAPGPAWFKFDWAEKTMLFSAFLPFVIRSRVQIEAFLVVFLLSSAGQILTFGSKTLLTGGGYGRDLGLVGGNVRLGEGSFLSALCALLVPVMVHLHRYGRLIPRWRILRPLMPVLIVLAAACAYGTYERTALIGLGIALGGLWWRSGRRIAFGLAGISLVAIVVASADPAWIARMTTTTQFNSETSALGRLLVWQWTLDFVTSTHPFGGGFNSFYINTIPIPNPDGTIYMFHGKAFHSIYFEVLGEHGWPGLFLLLALIATSFASLRYVARTVRGSPEHAWLHDLSVTLQISSAAVFASGAFIGIGFQSVVWYLFSLSVILRHHVTMAQREASVVRRAPVVSTDTELILSPA